MGVWSVAKAGYPQQEKEPKSWVEEPQKLLKKSQWQQVIINSQQFKSKRKELRTAVTDKDTLFD